jgi:hypothetical protein
MASIEQIQALKESLIKQINTAFAPLLTKSASAVGDDAGAEHEEDAKLTPRQKLDKQLATATEKLTKLNEKIAGGKSKIPDKDEENKTKFEEVISKIGEKISELDAKEAKKAAPKPAKAKAEKVPEKAPDTTPKAEKAEEVKKHVPRITPAMTTKLKEAFETASAEWDDKYKKEFVTQVNSLDDEQFAEVGLEGHMSRFASTHAPAAAGGGGGAAAPKLKTLTVAELVKQNKNLKQVSAGVFQHKTTGEMVTGPAEDTNEEYEETTHDGDDIIVGMTTKRVYKPVEDAPDLFVGYLGVGEW